MLEACVTKQRITRKKQNKDENNTQKVISPYKYEGDDVVMQLRCQLKESQWFSHMTDEEIEQHCQKLAHKLATEEKDS